MSRGEGRFKTYPNRWGEGAVHRLLYSRENRVWYVACRSPHNDPHGKVVEPETPITCKKCLV